MKVTYFVTEEVSYSRSIEIEDGLDDDVIEKACLEDWTVNGNPLTDTVAVNEQEFDSYEVEDAAQAA